MNIIKGNSVNLSGTSIMIDFQIYCTEILS